MRWRDWQPSLVERTTLPAFLRFHRRTTGAVSAIKWLGGSVFSRTALVRSAVKSSPNVLRLEPAAAGLSPLFASSALLSAPLYHGWTNGAAESGSSADSLAAHATRASSSLGDAPRAGAAAW